MAGGWRDLAAESVSSPLLGEGRRSRGEGGIVISGPSSTPVPLPPQGRLKRGEHMPPWSKANEVF
jgi:hypothetical protein